MKPTILTCILGMLFLSSCTPENRIFEDHQSLSPDVEWHKEDMRTFKVDISNTAPSYNFNIAFRYANGFMWNKAKVIVKEVSPSGKETITPYELTVRDDQGNYLGDAGYVIFDSTHSVEPQKRFEETGTYTYTISHDMPRDDFPWAMEIGLVIDKNV